MSPATLHVGSSASFRSIISNPSCPSRLQPGPAELPPMQPIDPGGPVAGPGETFFRCASARVARPCVFGSYVPVLPIVHGAPFLWLHCSPTLSAAIPGGRGGDNGAL
eukprot:5831645-Pyramimonas_sp.AAC.1